MTQAAFAIPGDIATRTGGYIYERRVLEGLRALGHDVRHLALPAGFPEASPTDMEEALSILGQVPAGQPLILDGFLSGTLDTDGLSRLAPPLVAVVHHPLGLESGLPPQRARFLLAREAANLALMAHIVVPSPHTAATLVERFAVPRERITIAPPGFDAVTDAPQPVTPPMILSVGIVHPRKGHDILVEALARLRDLDWQAQIVGRVIDPDYDATLRESVARHALGERIRFAGEVGEAALAELYGQAGIFALATRYEGYGMVLGEALRHGLPVVSCRAGAVPDTVPPEASVLVPPDDPAAFADALRRLLTDDAVRARMAAAAGRAGAALPGWDATAATVSAVLDRVARG